MDLTSVRCGGQWLAVGVRVDAVTGTAVSIDLLPNGEAATLTAWVQAVASLLEAEILVSDDADGFKIAADAAGVDHQVCIAHVGRNTEAWVEAMISTLAADTDGSLAAIGVAPKQAVADCRDLLRLIRERQPTPEASATLESIHRRYLAAAKPTTGGTMSLAYRLRLFSLDRWNLWPRLTRYRIWARRPNPRRDHQCLRAGPPGGSRNATGPCAGISARSRCCMSAASSRPWAMRWMAPASLLPR